MKLVVPFFERELDDASAVAAHQRPVVLIAVAVTHFVSSPRAARIARVVWWQSRVQGA